MPTLLAVPLKYNLGSSTYQPTATHAQIVSGFNLVNQYYTEISFGSFHGWTVTVAPSTINCGSVSSALTVGTITAFAQATPAVAALNPNSYDIVVWVVDGNGPGTWAGMTNAVGGNRIAVKDYDYLPGLLGSGVAPSSTAHELGHALGLNHTHIWHCNAKAMFCQPGNVIEYVPGTDLMGDDEQDGFIAHPSVYEKWILGYVNLSSSAPDVPQFSASGGSRVDQTLILDCSDNPSATHPRGVHINMPASVLSDTVDGSGSGIDRIWIECRDPARFSPTFAGTSSFTGVANMTGGVICYLAEAAHQESGSYMLDGNAGTTTDPVADMFDPVLRPGQQRSLASSNLWIQCLSWDATNSRATIRLWYDPNGVAPPPPSGPPPPPSATTALVVPVKFKIGSTTYTPTVTGSAITSGMSLVNQYYTEASYGSFTGWTTTVANLLNIPGTILASDLTSAGLKNAADPLLSAAGYTAASYDVIIYVVSQNVEGLWGHQGWTVAIPGQRCYVSESDYVAAPDGNVRPSVTCHELGHAQGLNHCHGWHCNGTATFCQPAADILQYVGGDLMGDAGGGGLYTSHPNVFEKWQLGYVTLGTDVPQFTASGASRVDTTLVLDAIENPSPSNPRGVHINLPATVLKDTTYGTGFIDRVWLECRDPLVFSPYFESPYQAPISPDQGYAANLTGGVIMHLSEAAHPENGTWRLDGDAGSNPLVAGLPDFDMLDSVLKPGQQRSLGTSNLWIQCLGWDAVNSRATVRLWYDPAGTPPPAPDSTAPTVPTALAADSPDPATVRLSWTKSTDNIGVTAYKVYRDAALIKTLGKVTSYSDTTVTAATTYSYQVSALDAVGNESAHSTAASVTTGSGGGGGGTDPVFTVGIADGARTNSTTETFTWAPATGATWWTQLDNDAWVNRGSATTLTLSNLHGATRHRFRLMSVTAGVASKIAHREWDVVGPYSRVKFSVGSESCLVIPIQYGGNAPFTGQAPNTDPDNLKVLVCPIQKQGYALPGTTAQLQALCARAKALYEAASWGQITLTFTIAPKVTSETMDNPSSSNRQTYYGIKALHDAGVDYTGYDIILAYHGIPYGDTGDALNMGMSNLLVDLTATPRGAYAFLHELGHNLGMAHSGGNTASPYAGHSSVTAMGSTFLTSTEYGNGYDIMGSNMPDGRTYQMVAQPVMLQRWNAGWCRGSQVQLVSSAATYTLSAREDAAAAHSQALVVTGSDGQKYWVEFVNPGTDEAHDSNVKTATQTSGGTPQTLPYPGCLVYAQTTEGNGAVAFQNVNSYAIQPDGKPLGTLIYKTGDQFSDPSGAMTIKVTAVGSTTATVVITSPSAGALPVGYPTSFQRPGQVNDLRVSTAGNGHAKLDWTLPTNATGVLVYNSVTNVVTAVNGASTWTDTTNPTIGVTYYYYVSAVKSNSTLVPMSAPPSNMVAWSTADTTPLLPTGTPSDWQAQLDTINAFHQENSWGQFSLAFTLIPTVAVPHPTASVATTDPAYFGQFYTPMMQAADTAALAKGYDRSQYQHVYYMPPYVGDGMIGADIVVTNPSLTQPIVCLVPNGLDPTYVYGLNASTHEFGHSLGFSHANALDAGTVTISTTALNSAEANPPGAANVEYGNPTSTMGRGQPV